jgi:hypothetical protein
MKKNNCWEYKKCGREPGGAKADELGVCPSTEEKRLDGKHGGKNAGRTCWVIAGSLCGGKVQGTHVEKYVHCMNCDFYKSVRKDESGDFIHAIKLINILSEEDACLVGKK